MTNWRCTLRAVIYREPAVVHGLPAVCNRPNAARLLCIGVGGTITHAPVKPAMLWRGCRRTRCWLTDAPCGCRFSSRMPGAAYFDALFLRITSGACRGDSRDTLYRTPLPCFALRASKPSGRRRYKYSAGKISFATPHARAQSVCQPFHLCVASPCFRFRDAMRMKGIQAHRTSPSEVINAASESICR